MKSNVIFKIIIFFSGLALSPHLAFADTLAYRCWSFNVDGAGGRCTSPSLIFYSNGQYELGSEKGTYGMRDGKVILSESQFRGLGRLDENGHQIIFEYDSNGRRHTVTYVLAPGAVR